MTEHLTREGTMSSISLPTAALPASGLFWWDFKSKLKILLLGMISNNGLSTFFYELRKYDFKSVFISRVKLHYLQFLDTSVVIKCGGKPHLQLQSRTSSFYTSYAFASLYNRKHVERIAVTTPVPLPTRPPPHYGFTSSTVSNWVCSFEELSVALSSWHFKRLLHRTISQTLEENSFVPCKHLLQINKYMQLLLICS